MNTYELALVIVTFNRKQNLQVLLNNIYSGNEYEDCEIIVVDNNSTDGSREMLAEYKQNYNNLTLCLLDENTGGAGGFYYGVKQAYETGHEWIWIMDDDVIPLPIATKTLLRYGKEADCIQPAKIYHDGTEAPFEGLLNERNMRRRLIYWKDMKDKEFVPCNCASFEGLFFNRIVIDKIGLPDKDFFIGLDDLFFGLKVSEKCKFIYIKTPCLQKQFEKEKLIFGKRRMYSSSVFGRYFHLRNYWIVLRYLKNKNKLSFVAYFTYAYEATKALTLTLFIEHNFKGVNTLLRAIKHGVGNDMQSYKKIFFKGA